MKYQIGDKVKIRTWEDLEKEFVYADMHGGVFKCSLLFTKDMEKALPKDRILTIRVHSVDNNYLVEENHFYWSEDMMEEIEPKNIIDNKIFNRFELLDFGDKK